VRKATHSSLQLLNVAISPFNPRGAIQAVIPGSDDTILQDKVLEPGLKELVLAAALNNMATLKSGGEGKNWEADGDPTDIAIQVFAHKVGYGKPLL
jgi:magnesium-transporting ATPase (P-type)